MRRVLYILAAAAVAAVLLARSSGRSGLRAPARVSAAPAASTPAGLPERFQMRLLGERYRLSAEALEKARRDGFPLEEIALAANIAARVGRPLDEVLKARRDSADWVAIGKRFGLGEDEMLQPVAARASVEEDAFFRQLLQRRFGLSDLLIGRLRGEGFTSAEIIVAAEVTGGRESDVAGALYAHRSGISWQSAAAHASGGPPRAPEEKRAAPGSALAGKGGAR